MDLEAFAAILKGKTVKAVSSGDADRVASSDAEIETGDYDSEGGPVAIQFTDGSRIIIWASEWGGITYLKEQ